MICEPYQALYLYHPAEAQVKIEHIEIFLGFALSAGVVLYIILS